QLAQFIQAVIAQRLPEVSIVYERDVLGGTAISKAISPCFFVRWPPPFVTAAVEVNLAVDDALAIIEIGLDRAVGIQDTASTAELYAAFVAVTVRRDEVDPILKGASYPTTARRFFIQPVCGE